MKIFNKYTALIIVVLSIVMFWSLDVKGQQKEEVTLPLSNPDKPGKLKVHLINGSISVIGYPGNEVIVEATPVIESHKGNNKQTKNGLKRIVSNGIRFSAEEFDNTVKIKGADWNKTIDFKIKVPLKFSLDLKTLNDGDIYVENVTGEFEISNLNGAVDMKDINGSVVADALNEGVTISFNKVNEGEPMAFSSLNGDLEVTFPSGINADIRAKTDNGNLYTDFEIDVDKQKKQVFTERKNGVYKVTYDNSVFGQINGGGAEITFKTLNGDILIKKKK